MSFDELPKVDRPSENEDESSSYFRLHFSERNGFLTSKPEKDKGCDFLVELIHDGMSTNWRFPVQLKSIDDPDFIEKGTMISYPFEVSRLRYMLQSIPPVGLIVLYYPQNNTLYYEFAETLYRRLLEKREGNMTWKSQQSVNLHLPAINVIDRDNVAKIHQAILTRHQNSIDQFPSLLPTLSGSAGKQETLQKNDQIADIVEFLKKKGLDLFFSSQIPTLSKMVERFLLK